MGPDWKTLDPRGKPEDDGLWGYFNGGSSSMDPRVKPEDDGRVGCVFLLGPVWLSLVHSPINGGWHF